MEMAMIQLEKCEPTRMTYEWWVEKYGAIHYFVDEIAMDGILRKVPVNSLMFKRIRRWDDRA